MAIAATKESREMMRPSAKEHARPSDDIRARLRETLGTAGPFYAALYVTRWCLRQAVGLLEHGLVAIEQKKRIIHPWSISANRFTVADNKAIWHTHDWSSLGEEWTKNTEWKAGLVREFLTPLMPEGATMLEVGPGGGRWTEYLQRRAGRLIVADIAEQALSLCRDRFGACSNIEYLQTDGEHFGIADQSIDAIWSYDVFVHINPLNARAYFHEFHRILRAGGRAVIHHPGNPKAWQVVRPGWRSDLTDDMVRLFLEEAGLRLLRQTKDFVNDGDVLSVIEKPLPL